MIGVLNDGLSVSQKIATHTNPADIKNDIHQNTNIPDTLNFDGLLLKIIRMLPDYAILDGINISGEGSQKIADYLFNNNWYYAFNEACNLMNIYGDAIIVIGNEEIMKTLEGDESSIVESIKRKMITPFIASEYITTAPVRPVVVTSNFQQALITETLALQGTDQAISNEDGEELAFVQLDIETIDKVTKGKVKTSIYIHPSRVLYFRYDTLLSNTSNSNVKKSTTSLYSQIYASYTKYSSLVTECVKAVNKSNTTIATIDKDYLESSNGSSITEKLHNQYNNLEKKDKEGGLLLQVKSTENNISGGTVQTELLSFNRLQSNYAGLGDLVDIAAKNLCATVNIPQSILMANQPSGGLQTSTNEKDSFNQAVEIYARKYIQKNLDIVLKYLKESRLSLYNDEAWHFKEGLAYTTQESALIKKEKATHLKEIITALATAKENNIIQNTSPEVQQLIEVAIMEALK